MRYAILALLLLLAAPALHADDEAPPRVPLLPAGAELGKNAGFEDDLDGEVAGWHVHSPGGGLEARWGDFGIEGSKGVRFTGTTLPPAERVRAAIGQTVGDVPADREVSLTVWFRLTDFQGSCLVWARCDGADGVERRDGAYHNSQLAGYALEGTTIWSPVTIRLTTKKSTKRIAWGVLFRGTGEVRVDEAHVRAREAEAGPPASTALGPGLYRAEGRYRASVSKDTERLRVWVPVPILWRDQVPLDFRVWSEPDGHVGSVRLVRRPHGFHVADVEILDLEKGEDVRISWDGHVLVLPHEPSPVPKGVDLPVKDVPDDVKPWLAPTWCCDGESEAVAKVAADIREVGTSADVVVPATLGRMRRIFRSAEGHVDALTAEEALTKRGSCTSCANLGAALLRAHGIPARVIAGYPTWSGPLQTHYVVEYWLPEGGWRLMESTRCEDDRPGWEQIEVAMVLPEDEVEAKAGRRKGAAGGVPWLTLTEYPDAGSEGSGVSAYLIGATARRGCDHQAVKVAVFEEKDARSWAHARHRLSTHWRRLTKAAVEDPSAFARLARSDVLPGEIATLTDLMEALAAND